MLDFPTSISHPIPASRPALPPPASNIRRRPRYERHIHPGQTERDHAPGPGSHGGGPAALGRHRQATPRPGPSGGHGGPNRRGGRDAGGAPGPEGGGGVLRRQRGGGRGGDPDRPGGHPGGGPEHGRRAVLRLPHGPGGRGGGPSGGRGDAGPRGSPRSAGPGGHGGGDPEHDQGSRYGPLRRRGRPAGGAGRRTLW